MTTDNVVKFRTKITGFKVVTAPPQDAPSVASNDAVMDEAAAPKIEVMHEGISRPEALRGSSYKIKTPMSEHALYININDIVLNEGTEYESYQPYEIFINSKNMEHFQWVVALTCLISAIFRKGGDLTFLSHELKSIFDPHGGYFKKGGGYMPSLVAEIGWMLEKHLTYIGLNEIRPVTPKGITETVDASKSTEVQEAPEAVKEDDVSYSFPASATVCKNCSVKAYIVNEGCGKCLHCDFSHCG